MNSDLLDILGSIALLVFGTQHRDAIKNILDGSRSVGVALGRLIELFLCTNYHSILIAARLRAVGIYIVLCLAAAIWALIAPSACGAMPIMDRLTAAFVPAVMAAAFVIRRGWLVRRSRIPMLGIGTLLDLARRRRPQARLWQSWDPVDQERELEANGLRPEQVIQNEITPPAPAAAPTGARLAALTRELEMTRRFLADQIGRVYAPLLTPQELATTVQSLGGPIHRSPIPVLGTVTGDGLIVMGGASAAIAAFALYTSTTGYAAGAYYVFVLPFIAAFFVFVAEIGLVYGITLAVAEAATVNGIILSVGMLQLALRGLPGIKDTNVEQFLSSQGDEKVQSWVKSARDIARSIVGTLAVYLSLVVLLRHPYAIAFALFAAFVTYATHGNLRSVGESVDDLKKRDARRLALLFTALLVLGGTQIAMSFYAGGIVSAVDVILRGIDWAVHIVEVQPPLLRDPSQHPIVRLLSAAIFVAVFVAVARKLELVKAFETATRHPVVRYAALALVVIGGFALANVLVGIPHIATTSIREEMAARYICPVDGTMPVVASNQEPVMPTPPVPLVVPTTASPSVDVPATPPTSRRHHRPQRSPSRERPSTRDGWSDEDLRDLGSYLPGGSV